MLPESELSHLEILRIRLEVLRQEHGDLDEAIVAMTERGSDQLAVRRLKKKKLLLKDKMTALQIQMTPDIIA